MVFCHEAKNIRSWRKSSTSSLNIHPEATGRIQRKAWCLGPYVGVDYNLTLWPLQSRLQHIYQGQPYARVDLNPMPESTLSTSHELWIRPLLMGAGGVTPTPKSPPFVSLKYFLSQLEHRFSNIFSDGKFLSLRQPNMLFRVNKCEPGKVLWHPRGRSHGGHRCNVTKGGGTGWVWDSPHFALTRENQFGGLSLQCVVTDLVWLIKSVLCMPSIYCK